MAITSDLLDRFQENKVFQTAQTMNNIIKSNKKNGRFVPMETVTFQIRSSEKYLFGFNHSNYVVKREFLKKSSCTLTLLATCHCSIQSYFKIEFDLTTLFNIYFLYGKS